MKAKIRKANGWHKNHAVYEWQPPNSETWYLVRKDDLCVYTGQVGKSHYDLLRDFYNRLLQGEMITAEHCQYFRRPRLLLVDLTDGGGKAGQGNAAADPSLPDHQHAQHRPEACRSIALVSNLNGGESMGKKKQRGKEKEKTGYDPKAIREAAETLTGKQEKPKEKPAAKQPEKPTSAKPKAPTDDEILKALSEIGKAGSREISDKLGIKDPERGRASVRNAMKRLAEAGKVKVSKSGKQYRYEAA